MNTFKYIILSLLIRLVLGLHSCVDADISEAVSHDDFYATLNDADAAVMGIYGKVMGIADRLVVLNELRGDMLDVTLNADQDLIDINNQKAAKSNYWSDITPIYSVIQNCNDAMYNFDIMFKDNKLTQDQYNERYSDIGAIRTWLYYQLGVQFGTIPYITSPVVSLNDLAGQQTKMNLDELIPELIRFMESLPTLENYKNSKLITGTIDGVSLIPYFINKKCLLGDLYLFNNEYDKAAMMYRQVLAKDETAAITANSTSYRIYDDKSWQSGQVTYFSVLFNRYTPDDITKFYNAWINMFKNPADDRYVKNEMIWEMTFKSQFAPEYPFIKLFGTEGKGRYLLKPSKYAIDEMWGSERLRNGFPYDCRGISGGVTKTADGKYAVAKYSYNYDLTSPYDDSGKWFLYRAGLLHLRFAEAANRSESGGGYPRLAWALVNDGIRGEAFTWRHADGTTYRGDSINYSSYGPGKPYPAPYYFDGRFVDLPYFRSPWRYNGGIRGRANLQNTAFPSTVTNKQDSINFVEQMIVKEAGLETAFEGNRWTDLIRVARRLQKLNGTGGQFLQEKMRRKYELDGLPVPDFTNEANWYLPLYQ
ncbi:MAG: RagB/SusD family nutrient uptake outer membrane protein [Paludibacteraceae bacterium]